MNVMVERHIIRMGNPLLGLKAKTVEPAHATDLALIIPDMVETMNAAGGVGLAAPQIGVSLRVIIFKVPEDRATNLKGDYPSKTQALINPTINPLTSEKELGWEGCLSIPELRGEVPRYKKIRYTGLDSEGRDIVCFASGFHARVVQHEVDHLDGILYPERMVNLRRFGYAQELLIDADQASQEV